MKTNPIFIFPGPWYNLTFTGDGNGSATSIAYIGREGDTTTLSAIPNQGYQISSYSADYGTIDGSTYTFGNHDATISAYFEEYTPPTANHRYTITITDVSSPFYANTVCMDRNYEGQGTLYDEYDNELYNLEAWDSGTPDTELNVTNGSAIFYADNLVDNPPEGMFTFIADANNSYIGKINVYDNVLAQTILDYDFNNTTQPGEWIETSYMY